MTTPSDPYRSQAGASHTGPDPMGPAVTDSGLTPAGLTLQESARRHMWLHFTRMSSYNSSDMPVIVRGEGQYVYDQNGKRYLDGRARSG